LFWVWFEIFSYSDNKIVHRAGIGSTGISPPDFQQFLPRQRLAPVGDKQFQQFQFLFGQAEGLADGVLRHGI
jgi:hypothetical protein